MIRLEVLSVCFYYNASMTFTYLNKNQCTEVVFKIWFELLSKLKFDYQKTRCLYAFSSILNCPDIPEILVKELSLFLDKIVKLTDDVLENREKEDSNDDYDDDESSEDAEDD